MGFIDLWHGQHCQHSSADITDITFPFLKVTIRFGHPVSKVTIRHPSRFAYVSLTPLRQAAALVSHRLQGEKRRRHGGSKAWRFPFGHDEWYFFITYSILPTYDVNLSVFFLWCQFCHLSSCILFICYVPCECVVIYVYLLLLIEWEHIWDYHHSPSIQKSFAGLTRTKMDRNWKPTKHVELKQRVFDMTWLS